MPSSVFLTGKSSP